MKSAPAGDTKQSQPPGALSLSLPLIPKPRAGAHGRQQLGSSASSGAPRGGSGNLHSLCLAPSDPCFCSTSLEGPQTKLCHLDIGASWQLPNRTMWGRQGGSNETSVQSAASQRPPCHAGRADQLPQCPGAPTPREGCPVLATQKTTEEQCFSGPKPCIAHMHALLGSPLLLLFNFKV